VICLILRQPSHKLHKRKLLSFLVFEICVSFSFSLSIMEAKSALRIDRKSSIESEPRTLNINEIQCAREAAMYVVRTRTIEEAMSIFTEGLEPVVSVARDNIGTMMNPKDMQYLEELLHLQEIRDVVSAPF
ncbi:Coiled-coil domain-containing protein 18, putative isoform 2, partial [Theobroma cacao]